MFTATTFYAGGHKTITWAALRFTIHASEIVPWPPSMDCSVASINGLQIRDQSIVGFDVVLKWF